MMVSGAARPSRSIVPEARLRRDLARRPAKRCSKYVARLMDALDEIEDAVCNHWDELDVNTRETFRAMVIGAPIPGPSGFSVWLDIIWDRFEMAYARLRYRDEVNRYVARTYDLQRLVQERVGNDVWAETLSSPEDCEAIERGRADAIAGRTRELLES